MLRYIMIAGLVSTAACNKKPDTDSKAGAAPSAKVEVVAPPAGGCVAGATKDAEGGYCVKIPAEWKPKKDTSRTSVQINYGPDEYDIRISVTYHPKKEVEFAAMVESNKAFLGSLQAPKKAVGQGDLPDGGHWYAADLGDDILQGEAIMKDKNGVPIECYVNKSRDKFADAMEACKTLRAL